MRNISAGLSAHLAEDVTSLATCWRVRRRDGVVMGFTTHDRPIDFDGIHYLPSGAFSPTEIASSNALNVDNLDVTGVLSSAAITEADLQAGRYDFAEVEIFMLNWASPSDGRLSLRRGWIGEVTLKDGAFVAEVRGLMQAFQQTIGEVFSPECRADLGDGRCRVDLSLFTVTGTVSSVVDDSNFTDNARTEADGWFNYGLLRWMTGNNAGLAVEIRQQTGPGFVLYDAMPSAIVAGDIYTAYAGCDRRSGTCKSKFNNILNFRGEPFVPGTDSMFKYPGLK